MLSPYQVADLIISILTIIGALVSIWLLPGRLYRHLVWFAFGMIGTTFYIYVALSLPGSHDLSQIRILAQYTIVAVWLWEYNLKNWKGRK